MPKNIVNVPNLNLVIRSVEGARQFHLAPRVEKFGHTVTPAHDRYRFETRSELEFCFRLESAEAEAVDEMDNRLYRNRFPHLFVKLPGVSYRYEVHAERSAVFVIYPGSLLPNFVAAGISLDVPCREFAPTAEIRTLIEELHSLEDSVHLRGVPDRIDSTAFRLICAVCSQAAPAGDPAEDEIRKIASYLESHLTESVSLDDIAVRHGFSRRSFFRHWAGIYPVSPTQFIVRKRIELAKRLLGESNCPVSEIAALLGFTNTGYFIQLFKRHAGTTPAAYRGTVRKHSVPSAMTVR